MQRPKSMPILVTPTSTIRGVSIAIFLTMLWSCAAALPGVQLESSRKVAPRCSGGFPPRVARCRCGHWETRVKLGQAGRRRYTLSVFPKDRQGRRVPQELAFPYCRARKRLQRAGQKFRRLDAGHYKRGIVAGFLRAGAAPSGENARIGVDPQRLVLDPKDEAPFPYFLLPSLEPHERVGETRKHGDFAKLVRSGADLRFPDVALAQEKTDSLGQTGKIVQVYLDNDISAVILVDKVSLEASALGYDKRLCFFPRGKNAGIPSSFRASAR